MYLRSLIFEWVVGVDLTEDHVALRRSYAGDPMWERGVSGSALRIHVGFGNHDEFVEVCFNIVTSQATSLDRSLGLAAGSPRCGGMFVRDDVWMMVIEEGLFCVYDLNGCVI